jgi:hypothetical protein
LYNTIGYLGVIPNIVVTCTSSLTCLPKSARVIGSTTRKRETVMMTLCAIVGVAVLCVSVSAILELIFRAIDKMLDGDK